MTALYFEVSMDKKFMRKALELAKTAFDSGEVPVGAVIVKDGKVIGQGYNMREQKQNALSHAEIEAINSACKTLGSWRLDDCEMYVTLEPCPMCAGAIINARIPKVIVGAKDEKCGACGSVCDLFSMEFNHHPAVEFGLLEAEAQELLTDFFRDLREKIKDRPKWKKPE